MKNALKNQVGMLGDMFLWLVVNLKQGFIYFIKQALPQNKSAGSVPAKQAKESNKFSQKTLANLVNVYSLALFLLSFIIKN